MEWVVGERGKGRSRLRAEQTRRWTERLGPVRITSACQEAYV